MIKAITEELDYRRKIIEKALEQHYKKYVHGAHGPNEFDCAGLVWYVYNYVLHMNLYEGGIGLSTSTKIMTSSHGIINYYEEDILDKDLSMISEGDILFFHRQSFDEHCPNENNKYPGHCGIYLGNNRFIHAPSKVNHVAINDFNKSEYWTRKLVASKDVISTYKRN